MTIKEIAKLADVSIGTVSYVINNKGRVSPEVRERVWQIMQENGYTPNNNARNLVRGRNLRIGIVISDTDYLKSSIFFNNVAAGIIDKISPHNMDLVVQLKDNSFENWMQNAIGVDGAIVIDPESGDRFLQWMQSSKIPFVVIGRYGDGNNSVPSIDADTEGIAYRATGLLLEKGHRRLLFRLGYEYLTITEDHRKGAERALAEFGLTLSDAVFDYAAFELEEDPARLAEILKRHPDITAIVTASDAQALGCSIQLRALGIETPADMSLICLAGTYLTLNTFPRIAAFYTAFDRMGERIAEQLLTLFDRGGAGAVQAEHIKMDYTFEAGNSVAAPKTRA